MKKGLRWIVSVFFWIITIHISAQVSINSSFLQESYVTVNELCRLSLYNQGDELTVFITASISNGNNESVIDVQSMPFALASGLTQINPSDLDFYYVNFSSGPQGLYLKSRNQLLKKRVHHKSY